MSIQGNAAPIEWLLFGVALVTYFLSLDGLIRSLFDVGAARRAPLYDRVVAHGNMVQETLRHALGVLLLAFAALLLLLPPGPELTYGNSPGATVLLVFAIATGIIVSIKSLAERGVRHRLNLLETERRQISAGVSVPIKESC